MNINQYGQVTISKDEAFQALYNGTIENLDNVFLDNQNDIQQFNRSRDLNADKIKNLKVIESIDIPLTEFDFNNQNFWFTPEKYQSFDIAQWLLDQCQSDLERERILFELELFVQYNMINVLIYLKYLVDHMRANDIIWGVGRGSCVSSFALFLIGIHKVNSIKYDLDIKEFLK